MLFNSIEFAIFLPIVFLLYWFVFNQNLRLQNFFLVVASFVFYGWWDWRFLILMILSASVDFVVGIQLKKQEIKSKRKLLLIASITVNLGILCFFKYFNFFVDNFISAFTIIGYKLNSFTLKIILPVGISFYTFQAMSYTVDIYRKKLECTKSIVDYFAFISFFPQLVAGPIERATNLLPQFYKKRTFDNAKATDGLRQILWGLFKKIVIADNCATFVNEIFDNYQTLPASSLFLGAIFFTIQVYGDFSGYSDIAIGTGRLFGFKLMRNFNFPYFSRNIAEFWRRWHISLSTWFRDYLYFPLGGSRGSKWQTIRNILIMFIVSGFWHGAGWTYLAWGLYNGLLFLPLLLLGKNRKHTDIVARGKLLPSIKEVFQIGTTFLLVVMGLIIFRVNNISEAFDYIGRLFSSSLLSFPIIGEQLDAAITLLFICVLFSIEWIQRDKQHGLQIEIIRHPFAKWAIYNTLIWCIFYFGGEQKAFIYFQF